MSKPAIAVLPQRFNIHQLPAGAQIPADILQSRWVFFARTDHELSLVAPQEIQIADSRVETDWACLRVVGVLDFGLTGILAGISQTLAAADISLFALSTFDTDYILVKAADLDASISALQQADYPLILEN